MCINDLEPSRKKKTTQQTADTQKMKIIVKCNNENRNLQKIRTYKVLEVHKNNHLDFSHYLKH